MSGVLAAVDLGAQSGRVALGRIDRQRLTIEEVHRFPNEPRYEAGVLRWDEQRLQDEVAVGLRKASARARVESVGVDAWAVDFGLLDGQGRLIRNPVHYRDSRRAKAFEDVFDQVNPRELYERTGIQLLPINTLYELAAMVAEGDRALEAAHRLLMIPDLFNHWLCGSTTTERTNASTTQCFDPHVGTWATDLLERLAIPTDLLPDVVEPGTPLGAVTAEETGIAGASVVATATHDTAAAVAATPLRGERDAYLSVGTWSLVGVETKSAVVNEAAFRANLTNEAGVESTFRVLRNVTGLWLLQECRRVWSEAGRSYEFAELVRLASDAPALRSLVDPNDPVFTEPGDMPARIAAFCRQTAQDVPVDDAAVVRCVLESLALKHAQTVDLVAGATGREIELVHVVGGGANNELLCRWTAAAAGRPVVAGPAEATLIGNLIVQALALGEVSSLADGRQLVRDSFDLETFEPGRDPAWDEARERFDEISGPLPEMEICA